MTSTVGGVGDDGGVEPQPRGRFTVETLLRDVLGSEPGPAAGTGAYPALDELVHWFRAECAAIVAGCPPEAAPLRLPKARITDLLSCERGTVARLGGTGLGEAIVRGRLTDLVVGQHLVDRAASASSPPPVEDVLRDALAAAGEHDLLAWLDAADDDTAARLWAHADRTRGHLRRSWGTVPRDWWARTQERISIDVADGALLLAGQFDVALGGPPTGRPLVVVEVKAGHAADRHRRDLLWYALLSALRHGALPAVVATWTAEDDGLVPLDVTIGTVEAAARRGLAALEVLVELAAGRPPTERPHAGCRWCPVLDRCEPGLASLVQSPTDGTTASGEEWEPPEDDLPWG